jgi:ATP-dependent Clp protease ATP-binding subunit ClpC
MPIRRFSGYDDAARLALVDAGKAAEERRHSYIGTEHLLLGLVHDADGAVAGGLRQVGVEEKAVLDEIDRIIRLAGGSSFKSEGQVGLTPRAGWILDLAERAAVAEGSTTVSPEHLLLAILREGDGVAARVLKSLGATEDPVRAALSR